MSTQDNAVQSSVEFIASLGEALAKTDDVDTDVATILSNHLLVAEASDACVAAAKSALVKLAEDRIKAAEADAHD